MWGNDLKVKLKLREVQVMLHPLNRSGVPQPEGTNLVGALGMNSADLLSALEPGHAFHRVF
jgi:hypothetical protein